jgi:putative ABC transport system permease protein
MTFVVGMAIAGQTFYLFTVDNLRLFGALKAMGATNGRLLRMILLQALMVGLIGYGIGVGAASMVGYSLRGTEAAFRMLWHLLGTTGAAVTVICMISAAISLRKVMRLEPAIVFKT